MGRQEGQVVVEEKAVGSAADGHVELAGQVARAGRTQQGRLDGIHQGPGVDDLLGVDAGQGIAGDVARVVVARLAAGEANALQRRHQGRHVFEQQAPQLDVLAGGEVGTAVLAAAVDHISQHRQLLGADHAIGQAQPHHEAPRRHRAEEDAQPLQPDREGGLVQGFPALAAQLLQSGRQLEAAEIGFGLLNLGQGRLAGLGCDSHGPTPQSAKQRRNDQARAPQQSGCWSGGSEQAPMRATPQGKRQADRLRSYQQRQPDAETLMAERSARF